MTFRQTIKVVYNRVTEICGDETNPVALILTI